MATVTTEAASTATIALLASLLNTLLKKGTLTNDEMSEIIMATAASLHDAGNAEAIEVLSALLGDPQSVGVTPDK